MMSNNMILYNSANASVMYLKRREYIYVALEGFLNSETLSGFNKALAEGVIHRDVKKILIDTSKINVIKSEEIQWLTDNMSPYLAKNRISKVAFIKPENIFGFKSIEALTNAMKNKINVNVLLNMEQAEHWLFQ